MGNIPPSEQPPRDFSQPTAPPPTGVPASPKSNKVKHVKVIAIWMIVQGSLDCLMGILLMAMGPVMMTMMQREMSSAPGGGLLTGIYAILGIIVLIVGILNILAGVKNLKYRSRTLGIVAMACGFLSILGCYCFPTSLALFIYGLIIYLNEDVKAAFALGEKGINPDQIKT